MRLWAAAGAGGPDAPPDAPARMLAERGRRRRRASPRTRSGAGTSRRRGVRGIVRLPRGGRIVTRVRDAARRDASSGDFENPLGMDAAAAWLGRGDVVSLSSTSSLSSVGFQETVGRLPDAFLDEVDAVCVAVDSLGDRRAADELSLRRRFALVDAGVDGDRLSVHVAVPDVTVPWSEGPRDSPDWDPPSCVLGNFPHAFQHAARWARDVFGDYFESTFKKTSWRTCAIRRSRRRRSDRELGTSTRVWRTRETCTPRSSRNVRGTCTRACDGARETRRRVRPRASRDAIVVSGGPSRRVRRAVLDRNETRPDAARVRRERSGASRVRVLRREPSRGDVRSEGSIGSAVFATNAARRSPRMSRLAKRAKHAIEVTTGRSTRRRARSRPRLSSRRSRPSYRRGRAWRGIVSSRRRFFLAIPITLHAAAYACRAAVYRIPTPSDPIELEAVAANARPGLPTTALFAAALVAVETYKLAANRVAKDETRSRVRFPTRAGVESTRPFAHTYAALGANVYATARPTPVTRRVSVTAPGKPDLAWTAWDVVRRRLSRGRDPRRLRSRVRGTGRSPGSDGVVRREPSLRRFHEPREDRGATNDAPRGRRRGRRKAEPLPPATTPPRAPLRGRVADERRRRRRTGRSRARAMRRARGRRDGRRDGRGVA